MKNKTHNNLKTALLQSLVALLCALCAILFIGDYVQSVSADTSGYRGKNAVEAEYAVGTLIDNGGNITNGGKKAYGSQFTIFFAPAENYSVVSVFVGNVALAGKELSDAIETGSYTITVLGDTTVVVRTQKNRYNVTFQNGDTILASFKVEHGSKITYPNEIPIKEETDEFSYEFVGWKFNGTVYTELPIATNEYVFVAEFNALPKTQEQPASDSPSLWWVWTLAGAILLGLSICGIAWKRKGKSSLDK